MLGGNLQGFGLKLRPELPRERDVVAAGQPFDEQRLQTGIFLRLLGVAQQRAEVLAYVAIAFGGKLAIDERLQRFGQRSL